MDPLGLSLENFDAIGTWRQTGEADLPIDASGSCLMERSSRGLRGCERCCWSAGTSSSAP